MVLVLLAKFNPVPTNFTGRIQTVCNSVVFGKVLLAQQKYEACEAVLINTVSSAIGFIKWTCSEVLADLYGQAGRSRKTRELRGLDCVEYLSSIIDTTLGRWTWGSRQRVLPIPFRQ